MKATGRILAMVLLTQALAAPLVHAQSPSHDPVETQTFDNFEDLDEAHAAYLRKTGLQLERPEEEPAPPPAPPPRWLKGLFDFLSLFAPLFKLIFYGLGICVIAGVVYFLVSETLRLRFGRNKSEDGSADHVIADYQVDAGLARRLLDEADLLAQQGRFAEAVHLLLFRSIEDIQQRVDGGVPRSFTSREIGNMQRLPETARNALRPIILIVEGSFFGDREVDSGSWTSARAHYEEFAFGKGWAGA